MSEFRKLAFAGAVAGSVLAAGCSSSEIPKEDKAVQAEISAAAHRMGEQVLDACIELACDKSDEGSLYSYPDADDNSVSYSVNVDVEENVKTGKTEVADDGLITVYAHVNDEQLTTHTPYEVTMKADGSHFWVECATRSKALHLGGFDNWTDTPWIRTVSVPDALRDEDDPKFDSYRISTEDALLSGQEAADFADVLLAAAVEQTPAAELQSKINC